MPGFTNLRAMTCILKREFDEGLEWAKRTMRMPFPIGFWGHVTLVAANGNLGQIEEAKTALAEALKVKPDLSISYIMKTLPPRHKNGLDPYLAGLRLAGMPD